MNCIIEIAKKYDRGYITPEDVSEALKTNNETKVRLDLLEILSNTAGCGAEDAPLCAFVAWQGAAGLPPEP